MKTSIYLPDDLAEAVRRHGISISEVAQRALRKKISMLETMAQASQRITIDTAQGKRGFVGRWLIDPADDVYSGDTGADAGTRYGIGLTKMGNVVVYIAHANQQRGPTLEVFENLSKALSAGVPGDIIAQASSQLDPEAVVWLDV